ncbi:ThiF family adenylyltransferase [Homoserinibacter sp. GY 40078]|uniref:ThiF family adenylyltransferase n=1 Tax=Homoserinibacter sp. GY 40078 TaxID=2603275 RepID=UPI0011C7ADF3|nr:ThiF family adenylyltransferase [Homoserinibacter sp. GY 40078]TXK18571.1 molybdopterin biosynthesis protein MoeB [Homoserinibacter sp. GY 40078]
MDLATSPRYARQRILPGFGTEGQRRLADARVVVIGAGGLGSAVLPALAAAGVGTLVVVDPDVVDETNLHRQTLHGPGDVGRAKVESAAERLAEIAPELRVVQVALVFDARSAAEIVAGADVLVDASDNAAARFAADDAATAAGIPLVWGSALRFSGQAGVVWGAHGVDYRDLFPEPTDDPDTCEVAGVLPTVCTTIGGLMATEVLKLLTGVGTPLVGSVIDVDALTGAMRRLDFARDPDRDTSGPPTRPAAPQAAPQAATPAPDADAGIEPDELAAVLRSDTPPLLLDVREPWEVEAAALPGATVIPLGELPARIAELDPGLPTVVYCHHGVRSARALDLLRQAGFADARHLRGGIDSWSRAVDPSVPRY